MKGFWPLLCFLLLLVQGCDKPPSGPEVSESESATQLVNDRIRVGEGPVLGWEDLLLEVYPEKVWLTGVDVRILSAEGEEGNSQLLDLLTVGWTYPEEHARRFYPEKTVSPVFFRFSHPSQGVELPAGYGIPLWSNEPLTLRVRWRNQDIYQKDTEVKAVVRLHFVRDRILEQPLTPVLPGDLFVAAPINGDYQYNSRDKWELAPPGLSEDAEIFADGYRQNFSQNWLVAEGQQEVSFQMTGLTPHLPGGKVVYSTAYAYPPTRSVELEIGSSELRLEPDSFSSQSALELTEPTHIVVRVQQDVGQARKQNLTRLLLYFVDADWNGFPEMLQ